MPPPAPALMVPIASRSRLRATLLAWEIAPDRTRHARGLSPLDLSSGKHVAHRLRVPLPPGGRGDPASVQSFRDLV
jgi:hypothetical protein